MLGQDANLRRIPHRLRWLLWLLGDLDGQQDIFSRERKLRAHGSNEG